MWGRDRVKAEESVDKLSQNALFSNFALKILKLRKIFGQKICNQGPPNHLGTIWAYSLQNP